MDITNNEVSKKTTLIIFSILIVLVIIFASVFIFRKEKAIAPSEISSVETLEKKLEEKFGKDYEIKSREKYEDYEKITVDLRKLEIMPTPQAEAVIFVKDEKIVPMPESYAKKVVLDDMENTGEKGELISSKYFEEFSGFNNEKAYKNVYINSIKLEVPAKKESNMIPGDLDYQIIVIDEFGNILFRTYATQPY